MQYGRHLWFKAGLLQRLDTAQGKTPRAFLLSKGIMRLFHSIQADGYGGHPCLPELFCCNVIYKGGIGRHAPVEAHLLNVTCDPEKVRMHHWFSAGQTDSRFVRALLNSLKRPFDIIDRQCLPFCCAAAAAMSASQIAAVRYFKKQPPQTRRLFQVLSVPCDAFKL